MPNDAPFATDPAPAQVPANPASGQASVTQPAAALDPQSAGRVLQQAISNSLGPVFERMDRMEQRFNQPPPQPPAPPAGDDDWVDRITNPDKFRETVREVLKEAIGPVLAPVVESTRRSGEDAAKSRIVEEYGEEFWTEKVAPRYTGIMDQIRSTNPVAAINPEHIETVISSIVGGRDLSGEAAQARTKRDQARQAASRTPAPRFIGPGRPQLADDDGVADEDKSIVARIQRAMGKDSFSEKDILEGRKARALQEAS